MPAAGCCAAALCPRQATDSPAANVNKILSFMSMLFACVKVEDMPMLPQPAYHKKQPADYREPNQYCGTTGMKRAQDSIGAALVGR
jgi:hypothetical protein